MSTSIRETRVGVGSERPTPKNKLKYSFVRELNVVLEKFFETIEAQPGDTKFLLSFIEQFALTEAPLLSRLSFLCRLRSRLPGRLLR